MSCFISRHGQLSPGKPNPLYLSLNPRVKTAHANTQAMASAIIRIITGAPIISFLHALHFSLFWFLILNTASCSITFSCDIYPRFYDEFIKSQQWQRAALWKLVIQYVSLPVYLSLPLSLCLSQTFTHFLSSNRTQEEQKQHTDVKTLAVSSLWTLLIRLSLPGWLIYSEKLLLFFFLWNPFFRSLSISLPH